MKQSRRGLSLGTPLLVALLAAVLLPPMQSAFAQATRIVFLHHSCGQNLIEQGRVREALADLSHEFFDHGYNGEGLRLADGSYSGTHFDVPGDNTDPDGIAEVFDQPLHDPPDNTFSHLMQYDVIAFKSCFPTSNIGDDYQLDEYRSYYLSVRDRMAQHPEKVFIVVTQPPQVPGASDSAEASRARALADWLASDEYLSGHPNIFTFDFFAHLAGSDNFLRPEYRLDDYDAHPNERANRQIGPLFVDFVDQAVRSYEGGGPRPTAVPEAPAEEAPPLEEQPAEPVAQPAAGVVDDFEAGAGQWGTSAETGSSIACGPDSSSAHSGAASMRIQFNIGQDGWGDCGTNFDGSHDWSNGAGVSLWLRSDKAVEWATLMIFAGDADAPTPFEVDLEIVESDWWPLYVPWSEFQKAEWAEEGGPSELDPTQVTGYAFALGAAEGGGEGNLWVDDVALTQGPQDTAPPADTEPISEQGEAEGEPGAAGESQGGGGFCPLAAALAPVSVLSVVLGRRRRR